MRDFCQPIGPDHSLGVLGIEFPIPLQGPEILEAHFSYGKIHKHGINVSLMSIEAVAVHMASCAEARAVMGETIVHEITYHGDYTLSCLCGESYKWDRSQGGTHGLNFMHGYPLHEEHKNPDLTLAMHGSEPLIVWWMKRLGLWPSFVRWLAEDCMSDPPDELDDEQKFAEI